MRKSILFIPATHHPAALAQLKAFTRGEFSFAEGSSGWSQENNAEYILAAFHLDSALAAFGTVCLDSAGNITELTLKEEVEEDTAADLARVLRPWVRVGSFLYHPQEYNRKTLLCGWRFEQKEVRFESGLVVPVALLKQMRSSLQAQQSVLRPSRQGTELTSLEAQHAMEQGKEVLSLLESFFSLDTDGFPNLQEWE